ncbi:hypothetical protein Tco_0628906 [Tanacetum coccineum]|uniref:Uncharacterized protein n=1 Tax=Tanacetum coccineum TaxID=301880 RepID=A0ABQ4WRM9_9ASTR
MFMRLRCLRVFTASIRAGRTSWSWIRVGEVRQLGTAGGWTYHRLWADTLRILLIRLMAAQDARCPRELGYGNRDDLEDLVGANQRDSTDTLEGVNQRVYELSATVRRGRMRSYISAGLMHGYDRALLIARVNNGE